MRQRRSRRELINQPNENIPTDTKTSYSHIKGEGVGGEVGKERARGDGGGMRWRIVGGSHIEVMK